MMSMILRLSSFGLGAPRDLVRARRAWGRYCDMRRQEGQTCRTFPKDWE